MDKMGALDHSDVKFMYFYMVLVDSAQQILKRKDKVISCSCTVICLVPYSSRVGYACCLAYLHLVCSICLSMDKKLPHCSSSRFNCL